MFKDNFKIWSKVYKYKKDDDNKWLEQNVDTCVIDLIGSVLNGSEDIESKYSNLFRYIFRMNKTINEAAIELADSILDKYKDEKVCVVSETIMKNNLQGACEGAIRSVLKTYESYLKTLTNVANNPIGEDIYKKFKNLSNKITKHFVFGDIYNLREEGIPTEEFKIKTFLNKKCDDAKLPNISEYILVKGSQTGEIYGELQAALEEYLKNILFSK